MNFRLFIRVTCVLVVLPIGFLHAEEAGGLFEIGQSSRQAFSNWSYGYGALTNDQSHVAAYVSGSDSQRIHVGSNVEVRLEGMSQDSPMLSGTVTDLLREADPRTHQAIATIQISRQSFSPRTYAHVQIELSSRRALAVPTTAVIWIDGKPKVFKQKDKNDFDPIQVDVGQQTPTFTEIKRGLNPGDKILIEGALEWEAHENGTGEGD